MAISTATAVLALGHPNLDTVYIVQLVDEDETRGTAVTYRFWPFVSRYVPTSFGGLVRRQFVNRPGSVVPIPRYLLCVLRTGCRG